MKKRGKNTKSTWVDPDDAPELTDAWFRKASLYQGKKLIRRGRPRKPLLARKVSIHLRLDPDIAKALRATGRGWQTRINDALRAILAEDRL